MLKGKYGSSSSSVVCELVGSIGLATSSSKPELNILIIDYIHVARVDTRAVNLNASWTRPAMAITHAPTSSFAKAQILCTTTAAPTVTAPGCQAL